ncbi:MAG TPA: SGNH/GDSL hydrolase family protein [Pirellulales bacterium]|nr:SGNH/GDSL hydrolase family protein [Pirellulales bacterium]
MIQNLANARAWQACCGCLVAILAISLAAPAAIAAGPAGNKWEEEIQAFERQDAKHRPPENAVLFVGSSSIRLWKLKESFPDLDAINRGFGGSELADSAHFVDRIVIPYKPRLVVLYAGDNDLAAGKKPQQVLADFKRFDAKVKAALPETRIVFLSIKPSIQRRALIDKVRATNTAIEKFISGDERLTYVDVFQPMLTAKGEPRPELFRADGLHLNAEGYKLWASLLQPTLTKAD